jgi:hypothetical protein
MRRGSECLRPVSPAGLCEVTLIANVNQLRHGKILAVLLILYGGAHLLAASFVWVIVLALAGQGYSGQLREPKTFALFCLPLLTVVPPMLSRYSLLRRRRWAGRAVLLMCLAVLTFDLIVIAQISQPGLSATRTTFGILYCGASTALCLYGIWFVKGKSPV